MEGQATPTLGQPSEPCSPRATSEGPAPRHGRGHQLTEAVAISQTLCLRCACCHHQQVPQELERGGTRVSSLCMCVPACVPGTTLDSPQCPGDPHG